MLGSRAGGGVVTPIGGLVYMWLSRLWVTLQCFARFIGHFCEVSHGLWVSLRSFALVVGLLNEHLPTLWVDFCCQCRSE